MYNTIRLLKGEGRYQRKAFEENFSQGDILIPDYVTSDITSEEDIQSEYYNITSLNNNVFGNNKHIHIGGK